MFFLAAVNCMAQENLNMELVAQVPFGEDGNDIWGYVAPDGTEYAVCGSQNFTRIYNLDDPSAPDEVAMIAGASSIWRDIKSWNQHLYVTTDQGTDGLLIIDMTNAPDSITHTFWKPSIDINGSVDVLRTCHNLYIDENGVCYLAGCNNGNGGAIILDITTDPNEPIVLGAENFRYAHDVFVKNDLLYASEINNGVLSIYDVSDKANPIPLGSASTTSNFTHNAWLSDDGNYVFTTDERPDAFVDAFDVSDPSDIRLVDSFQPSETAGNGVVPHNTHYKDGFLVTSWYTDGVVITDASKPDNLVKVGQYDTYLGPDGGFNGCWGVYPWLPSGLIIATNVEDVGGGGSLIVIDATYVKASFLEGNVSSLTTGNPINGVDITIAGPNVNSLSDAMGEYGSGVAASGDFDVTYSHPDYISQTISVSLATGETTVQDVILEQKPTISITGTVLDAGSGLPLPNAIVQYSDGIRNLELVTNSDGIFDVTAIQSSYTGVVGAWGYLHLVVSDTIIDNTSGLVYELSQGYQDDFVLDQGWTVTNTATTGFWERGAPVGTTFQGSLSNVNQDDLFDIGDQAYVTGNGGGGAGTDDVDDGSTVLTSPEINLTTYTKPVIRFKGYFFNAGGAGATNDSLIVELHTADTTITIIEISEDIGLWSELSYSLTDDVIDFKNTPFTISFTASDFDPGHLVEAGIDAFKIEEDGSVDVKDLLTNHDISVFPNPFTDAVTVSLDSDNYTAITIYNTIGKLVYINNDITNGDTTISIDGPAGVYNLVVEDKQGNQWNSRLIMSK